MNSPVSCLPDPIQNMAKKKTQKNKNPIRRIPRPPGRSPPVAMGGVVTKQRSNLPLISGIGETMLVKNFELVTAFPTQDAIAAFKATNIVCNPGIAASFPWLSQIALNYSKFAWKYLRFMYVPQVATTTAGVVWINASYDPADTAPTSLASVSQNDSSSIGPAWQGGGINAEKAFRSSIGVDEMIFVDIDCSNFTQPYYYIRKAVNLDADTIVMKLFYGNDVSVPATVTPGSLYVSYVCALSEPVAPALNA